MSARNGAVSVTATAHAERQAAIEAFKQEAANLRDAEIKRLHDLQQVARETCEREIASAIAAAEAQASELDAALARDVCARLDPLAARFGDAPRTTAAEIAAAWRELAARSQHELGDELAAQHLGLAFLAAQGDDCLARAGTNDLWEIVGNRRTDLLTRAVHLIMTGASAPAVEGALRELEVAVTEAAAAIRYPDARRAAVRRGHASSRRIGSALMDHDRACEAERQRALRPEGEGASAVDWPERGAGR